MIAHFAFQINCLPKSKSIQFVDGGGVIGKERHRVNNNNNGLRDPNQWLLTITVRQEW